MQFREAGLEKQTEKQGEREIVASNLQKSVFDDIDLHEKDTQADNHRGELLGQPVQGVCAIVSISWKH